MVTDEERRVMVAAIRAWRETVRWRPQRRDDLADLTIKRWVHGRLSMWEWIRWRWARIRYVHGWRR